MSKKNSIGSVFIAILSILLVVAVVAFIFKFTNGLNEDLKTFYIEHNGKQIVATDSQMTFDTESEHRFDCKYISNPDNNTFNLKVVPNVTEETDFSFTVDGKSHKWSEVEDLTSCFNLDKQANYFIVSFPADFSMQGVLNSLYPESQVVISETLSLYQYYYTLHVSNYNEKINYYIDFNVSDAVDYVTLINEQIETIAQLDDKIDNLENQITELEASLDNKNTKIIDLKNQVDFLTEEKSKLQESILFYEDYISKLETSETAMVTLKVDGSVYDIFSVKKGVINFDIDIPDTDNYIFNGWLVDGELIDMNDYNITENVIFVADLIPLYYTVSFISSNEEILSEKVLKDSSISPPSFLLLDNPEGYIFSCWVDSNGEIVDFSNYVAHENMIFTARFIKELDIEFYSEDLLISLQTIIISDIPIYFPSENTVVDVPSVSKNGYTFDCWQNTDGEKIDFSNYVFTKDEKFFAQYNLNLVNISLLWSYEFENPDKFDNNLYGVFSTREVLLSIDDSEFTCSIDFNSGYYLSNLIFSVYSSDGDLLSSYPFSIFPSMFNLVQFDLESYETSSSYIVVFDMLEA